VAAVLVAGVWLAVQRGAREQQRPQVAARPPAARPAEPARPGAVVVLALSAGGLRSNADLPVLVLTPAAAEARLELEVPRGRRDTSYRAELRTSRGETAWSASGLPPHTASYGTAVILAVPASALQSGQYEITLSLSGAQPEYYSFRVVKNP
jgi:hypothetical protein